MNSDHLGLIEMLSIFGIGIALVVAELVHLHWQDRKTKPSSRDDDVDHPQS